MNELIDKALRVAPDCSEDFTNTVAGMRRKLELAMEAPVYHDSDMNYSASQKLSVFLDAQGKPVQREDPWATNEVVLLISSRAKLYTTLGLERLVGNEWRVRTCDTAPGLLSALHRLLQEEGYAHVQGTVLSEPAEGAVTEMDGVPATVFQVLFSEMY